MRRQLCLLRLLERPSTYPSLSDICNRLREKDFSQVSAPTVERDLSDIRHQYGLTVTFDRRKGGYCLDLPTEADVDDFVQYVRLLERSLRIETLAKPGVAVGRYLQLERHDGFRGLDLLEPLWNALHLQRVVGFQYQPYPQEGNARDGQRWRSVEPGLLFEYRNRWYLDGFDLETDKGHRTFGLDRMSDLTLDTRTVDTRRGMDYRAARRQVIGVTAPPGAPVERVVLRFDRTEAEYVRSLPLHDSQQTIAETPGYLDFELHVVVNHELRREILAFGSQVEVLEPAALRADVAARLKAGWERYTEQE